MWDWCIRLAERLEPSDENASASVIVHAIINYTPDANRCAISSMIRELFRQGRKESGDAVLAARFLGIKVVVVARPVR